MCILVQFNSFEYLIQLFGLGVLFSVLFLLVNCVTYNGVCVFLDIDVCCSFSCSLSYFSLSTSNSVPNFYLCPGRVPVDIMIVGVVLFVC